MLVALATFAAAAALIVLLPGPDTLVVLRALLRDGRGRAVQAVAGVLCGLAAWVCAAVLGLSALLRASHAGYVGLKIAGAGYLIWLGVQSLRMRRMAEHTEHTGKPRRQLLGLGYLAGLSTDLLNPKVGVFFVTFLPGFVPHGQSIAATSLLFGAIFIAETAMYFAVLLTVATPVTRWMSSSRVRRRMDVGTGVVLIGLGVRLAVEP
jgi:threonine/homoserine/homoserine lactone efflux protein